MTEFRTDPEMETAVERRAEIRRKALKGGLVAFNKGYSAYECVVRNVSQHGARLVFADIAAVPHEFDLTISGDGGRRKAEIRWRNGDVMGVALA